jgi:hypothetical protein
MTCMTGDDGDSVTQRTKEQERNVEIHGGVFTPGDRSCHAWTNTYSWESERGVAVKSLQRR